MLEAQAERALAAERDAPTPATRAETEADRNTYEAGLGATVESDEKPVFIKSIKRIRKQMQAWGFTLKQFTHPKIEGAF